MCVGEIPHSSCSGSNPIHFAPNAAVEITGVVRLLQLQPFLHKFLLQLLEHRDDAWRVAFFGDPLPWMLKASPYMETSGV